MFLKRENCYIGFAVEILIFLAFASSLTNPIFRVFLSKCVNGLCDTMIVDREAIVGVDIPQCVSGLHVSKYLVREKIIIGYVSVDGDSIPVSPVDDENAQETIEERAMFNVHRTIVLGCLSGIAIIIFSMIQFNRLLKRSEPHTPTIPPSCP